MSGDTGNAVTSSIAEQSLEGEDSGGDDKRLSNSGVANRIGVADRAVSD
jgi:hypothetical protein